MRVCVWACGECEGAHVKVGGLRTWMDVGSAGVTVKVLRGAGVKWHLTAWLYVHSGGDEKESIVL